MMKIFVPSVLMLMVLTACPQPVLRKTETPEGREVSGPEANQAFKKPDLRKRLWLMPFPEFLNPPAEVSGLPVSQILYAEMEKALGNDKDSPFILPSKGEFFMADFGLTMESPATEIGRAARSAAVPGFLTGKISSLELKDESQGEGILEATTYVLTVGLDYELWDSTSGRRLAQGYEKHSLKDQRSGILGKGLSKENLRRKLQSLGAELSKKVYLRLAQFSEKMGWSGRILKMESSRAYVNAGRRSGIKLDDVLKVLEPSKNVYDSESGRLMGPAPGRIKGTLKVIQFFGEDGAVAAIQSGGGFQDGDLVELY